MNPRTCRISKGYRIRLHHNTGSKVPIDHLTYSTGIRDTAKSGIGCTGNRHLNYLVEFIFVNVGGSYRNVKESSPLRSGMSVGGLIVVGGWESQPQGEAAIRSLEMTPCVRDEGLRSRDL